MKNQEKKNKPGRADKKSSGIIHSFHKKISNIRKSSAALNSAKKTKKTTSIEIEKIAVANMDSAQRSTGLDNGFNAELYKFNPLQDKKFESPAAVISDTAIPERYHDDRIIVMPRDPWWIFCYWDISEDRKNNVINLIGEEERNSLRLVIRIYDITDKEFNGYNANGYFDIDVPSLNCNWYVNTNKPGRSFCIEIGFKTASGAFFMMARSNVIKSPRYGVSSTIDELWMLPDDAFFKIMGRFNMNMKSSFEEKHEIHWESFFEQMFRSQVSSGEFSSLFSFLGKEERKRNFFLEVWTDVIVYGRTMPDADVSLCGKKVNLTREGTFKAHYTLPKGKFFFPVVATSNDKIDTLRKTPIVERKEQ